jgi:hypothetical protein
MDGDKAATGRFFEPHPAPTLIPVAPGSFKQGSKLILMCCAGSKGFLQANFIDEISDHSSFITEQKERYT